MSAWLYNYNNIQSKKSTAEIDQQQASDVAEYPNSYLKSHCLKLHESVRGHHYK